jgi:hypothetical protein
MNDEIKIPEVKNDIPDYPNWKNGMKWGLFWSFPVFIIFLMTPTTSNPPFPPWYEEMFKSIIPSIFFSSILFAVITALVACKPIRKMKR